MFPHGDEYAARVTRHSPKRWQTLLLSVVIGLCIGLGQPPMMLWPVMMVGVAAFTWLTTGMSKRAAFGHGYIVGLAMNALTISWIGVLGVPIAIALIAFMALWYGVLGIVISRLVQLPGWPLWVAAAWGCMEFAAIRMPFGGFAWTRLAFASTDMPLSGFLPYIGASGVGILIALISNLLLSITRKRWIAQALTASLAFVVGGSLLWIPPDAAGETINIGLAQPNVNRELYGTPEYPRAVTNNTLSSTIMLAADARLQDKPMDFVLWPESATDHDPLLDARAKQQVRLAVALAEAPVLVGAVTYPETPPDSRQTTSIWWSEEGPGEMYHKRNLVPFGEWIPFRQQLLPVIPMLEMVGKQGVPGDAPGVVTGTDRDGKPLAIGAIICFELAYDETVYDTVRHGGEIIVSQSNENTYAGTFQIAQQFNQNRIRAKELRREIFVSTLNSVSGFVDATGRTHDLTGEYEAAARIVELPRRTNRTSALDVGPLLNWTSVLLTFGGLAAAFVRARSSRVNSMGTGDREGK